MARLDLFNIFADRKRKRAEEELERVLRTLFMLKEHIKQYPPRKREKVFLEVINAVLYGKNWEFIEETLLRSKKENKDV